MALGEVPPAQVIWSSIISTWGWELSQNSAKYASSTWVRPPPAGGKYRRKRKQYRLPPGGVSQVPAAQARRDSADNGSVMALRTSSCPRWRVPGGASEVQWPHQRGDVNRTEWFACFSVETGEPCLGQGWLHCRCDVGIENLTVLTGPWWRIPGCKPALRRRNLDKAIARSRKAQSAHSNRRERLYARRRRLARRQRQERPAPQGHNGYSQVRAGW